MAPSSTLCEETLEAWKINSTSNDKNLISGGEIQLKETPIARVGMKIPSQDADDNIGDGPIFIKKSNDFTSSNNRLLTKHRNQQNFPSQSSMVTPVATTPIVAAQAKANALISHAFELQDRQSNYRHIDDNDYSDTEETVKTEVLDQRSQVLSQFDQISGKYGRNALKTDKHVTTKYVKTGSSSND